MTFSESRTVTSRNDDEAAAHIAPSKAVQGGVDAPERETLDVPPEPAVPGEGEHGLQIAPRAPDGRGDMGFVREVAETDGQGSAGLADEHEESSALEDPGAGT